jgi:hypothetical protein
MRQCNNNSEEAAAQQAYQEGRISANELINVLRYLRGRTTTVVKNVSSGSKVKKWRV